jgi:hypothetical protein
VELDPPNVTDAGADASPDATSDAGGQDGSCLISRVQVTHNNTQKGTSDNISIPFGKDEKAGNFLAVGVNYVRCPSVKNIADTVGNTYEQYVPAETLGDAGTLETWGAKNIRGGANTITVTFGGVCPEMNMKVVEYSGVDPDTPIENKLSAHGTGDPPNASIFVSAPELLFAHTADSLVAQDVGAGWTQVLFDEWKTITEDRWAAAPGNYPVTFVPGSDESWVIQAMGLRCK